MSGGVSGRATAGVDDYTVRPYDPSDAEGVCALAELVWGSDRSVEWLA